MLEDDSLRFCPNIAEAFREYPEMLVPPHPIGSLLRYDHDSAGKVRARTEQCLKLVLLHNRSWLQSKIRRMRREEKDVANVRALLGEIRAYGELLCTWRPERIKTKAVGRGCDFLVEIAGTDLWIEVQTPNSGPPEKCIRVHEETTDGNVSWRMSEIAPFGFPNGLCETFHSQCASKITRVKKEEHQFDGSAASVLWLDLKDPTIWYCGFPSVHTLPLYWEKQTLVPGFVWHALYAQEGDPTFDGLNVWGMHRRPRPMPFSGRFNQETLIDFVILDIWSDKIVFENHKKKKQIPNEVYRDLFRLFPFNFQLSWLDWPIRGSLGERIERSRSEIKAFCSVLASP